MASLPSVTQQRLRIVVQGIVQGVGFRPFVYGQAQRWQLGGFVLNDSDGVTIEIEGAATSLDGFMGALREDAPALARIDSITIESIEPRHVTAFVIEHSHANATRSTLISPDTATCADCLRELHDPHDRRYAYPFINCTNCGPRFTIVQDIPYDRDKTTMRVFPLCPACKAEYEDPLNRRFHAQPNACPVCGPHVSLLDWRTAQEITQDAIIMAAQQLARGAILAIKGLGGYHLACNACDEEAVRRLRTRKQREAKPFALMVPDIETARRLCYVNEAEAALLQSHRRPIVLLKRLSVDLRTSMDMPPETSAICPDATHAGIASSVAPQHDTLGTMLPYTPLHHLLLQHYAQAIDNRYPPVLVMTSGNLSEEPIAYRDQDAAARLSLIADGMLTHNRTIHMRCDDTVMRVVAGKEQFFRRSRGYTPEPLSLPFACPVPLLACGGHLKNTFCLGRGKQAFMSHHIGDLENAETLLSFREGIEHFERLFGIEPRAIAYDLHPDYLATRYALDSSIEPKIGVQHHHAHIASVLAEHGITSQVIGVAADGTGYGDDGAIWGGEVFVADMREYQRVAHLSYIPLIGGEQAVRHPWRVAAAYLSLAYGDITRVPSIPFTQRLDSAVWRILSQMMAKGINSPLTSSTGRLFDAVASLLNVRNDVLYEGQAAIELEMLATQAAHDTSSYPFTIQQRADEVLHIDMLPTVRAIVEDIAHGLSVAAIARKFHYTVAEAFVAVCEYIRTRRGLQDVALSGGVFQNRLLLEYTVQRLKENDFHVYINHRVPPNDGGLSLGQLAVAAARYIGGNHADERNQARRA